MYEAFSRKDAVSSGDGLALGSTIIVVVVIVIVVVVGR
jgi:hypothetical protein